MRSNVHLSNTRWISNSAEMGGAIQLYSDSALSFQGTTNIFVNNSATLEGGALWMHSSFAYLDGSETFRNNNVGGNVTAASANAFLSLATLNYPPGGVSIPYVVGPVVSYPQSYVDANSNCGSACNGSQDAPFSNIEDGYLLGLSRSGGFLYLKPGTYAGPKNSNIQLQFMYLTIARWPQTTGKVVIDCQGNGFGFMFDSGDFQISDITIQNCVTNSTNGGAGMYLNFTSANLDGVYFVNNTATQGPGGGISILARTMSFNGGGFVGNSATGGGGGLAAQQAAVFLSGGTVFSANSVLGSANDLICNAFGVVTSDGTPLFEPGGQGNCEYVVSSQNSLAVFTGKLGNLQLYPKNSQGLLSDLFAGLLFDSLVELDPNGNPINSTRVTLQQLTWSVTKTTHTRFVRFQYDGLGPDVQFIRDSGLLPAEQNPHRR